MHSLTRYHRGLVLMAAGALWLLCSNPMLLLIAAGSVYRLFTADWQQEPDHTGVMQFVGLLIAFTTVVTLTAPIATVAGVH
jgi:hypothetical protein